MKAKSDACVVCWQSGGIYMNNETYYIIGESRTNLDNAITKVYGTFYIAFELIPETEEILNVECSRTLELTNDFIRRIFLHRYLIKDAEALEAEIKRRYHGSSAKAILVAYRDAQKHYHRVMEHEQAGK